MDNVFDVPDPTDWLGTSVSKLAPVEAALRCQVCKDFFTTPVITSCSHTFCSLCIRRCLTTDGQCPTCRAKDQEVKLRPNWIVQELVESFQAARADVLRLGKDDVRYKNGEGQGGKKRSREIMDSDEDEAALSEPNTRRKMTRSQKKTGVLDNAKEDVDLEMDDGLVACPICNLRMKEEAVPVHFVVHDEPKATNGEAAKDGHTITESQPFLEMGSRLRTLPKLAMERLPQLNYSLMNETALRKKLTGLGIPHNGPRTLLEKRHTEWKNLVNSNCDSKTPKSKRELLHDLDTWERSQGRQVVNNDFAGSSVMDKDFNSQEWGAKHDDSYKQLIAEARKKAHLSKTSVSKAEGEQHERAEADTRIENGAALDK